MNSNVHLVPLASVVRTMFFRFTLPLTQHFDATTVDQQVQSSRRFVRRKPDVMLAYAGVEEAPPKR